ncbi:MAG: SEC-C metal-binding domain-containing protein [Acidobacteriota bacterium]
MSLTSWFKSLFSKAERPKDVVLGRNDDCWCGSGKKYKKCHLDSDAAKSREAGYAAQFTARNRMGDGIVPGSGGKKKAQSLPPENKAASDRL